MKQNDLLCVLKGSGRPHVTPHTQEAALMRLSVTSLRRMIKGKLQVEFVRHELTSYSGLELVRRYLRQLDVPSRLRSEEHTSELQSQSNLVCRLLLEKK